jgi:hypothetical protein
MINPSRKTIGNRRAALRLRIVLQMPKPVNSIQVIGDAARRARLEQAQALVHHARLS